MSSIRRTLYLVFFMMDRKQVRVITIFRCSVRQSFFIFGLIIENNMQLQVMSCKESWVIATYSEQCQL